MGSNTMRKFLILLAFLFLSGCGTLDTVRKYWPRSHDPVMFKQLVDLDISIEKQKCSDAAWQSLILDAERLARYAEWRRDPQAENLRGLEKHIEKLSSSSSPAFCEIGKNLARQRIAATRRAWELR